MTYQKSKPPPRTRPLPQKASPLAPGLSAKPARQDSHGELSPEEVENEAFRQDRLESSGLEAAAKRGSITIEGQERLGVLQAKMSSFWDQRMERAQRRPNVLAVLSKQAADPTAGAAAERASQQSRGEAVAVAQALSRRSQPPRETVQALFAGSDLPESLVPEGLFRASIEAPIQAVRGSSVSSVDTFRSNTTDSSGQPRSATVEAIDTALIAYHASDQAHALAALDALISAIDSYVASDGASATRPWIAEARTLHAAAAAERENVAKLDALSQRGIAADLTDIARLSARSRAEIVQLAALDQVRTVADLIAIAASPRPVAAIIEISGSGVPPAVVAQVAEATVSLEKVDQSDFTRGLSSRTPEAYGMSRAERFKVVLDAKSAEDRWYGSISEIRGQYSQEVRLHDWQAEVTGPDGGNTDENNYEKQVHDLEALGEPVRGTQWYMLDAVAAHERVHSEHFLPGLKELEPKIQARFLKLSVSRTAEISTAAEAIAAIKALSDYQRAYGLAQKEWTDKVEAQQEVDHDEGAAAEAERAIVYPMIARIKAAAKEKGWKTKASDTSAGGGSSSGTSAEGGGPSSGTQTRDGKS